MTTKRELEYQKQKRKILSKHGIINKRYRKFQIEYNNTINALNSKFFSKEIEKEDHLKQLNYFLMNHNTLRWKIHLRIYVEPAFHWMKIAKVKTTQRKRFLQDYIKNAPRKVFDKWLNFARFEHYYKYEYASECHLCRNWYGCGRGICGKILSKTLIGYRRVKKKSCTLCKGSFEKTCCVINTRLF